ncbi:16S rRNA (cytidine(1402)-2'-O)-methyltransferase [Comamonas sp. NLF-1-9]|uniref:16S rRNA (cytidine(1402)-2'-O)-methyltransferase n=1 Tax=Comamonas sp. NLF-1-9 TaxID=2853163 RepID=UPI001C4803FC|nr:16S rRNA (cytidine(1402)-2'-O)-methyltransferase [Comamonas sp. NLF-1-9]QXL84257.1 16S rRNA (cytidine(1402)-2'-O)-methyltransferase [Comamonas sp. NLF-1-9]
MSVSYATALVGARDAAGAQNYPKGALYVVATPIGNLADITLRALQVLQLADLLACEDTRHSQQLLRAYGMDKAPGQWLALHQHNEAEAAQTVLQRLALGERVAYLSDAGTPAISDPGARLVAAAQAAGVRCIPLPGASSLTASLSVAGAVAPADAPQGFVFHGFLPARAGERKSAWEQLAAEPRAIVLLEAPHRMATLVRELAALGERRVTLARELTKQFEEVATLPARDCAAWLQQGAQRSRGEFAIVLHPQACGAGAPPGRGDEVLRLLLPELALKRAVQIAAALTGEGRNALYERALALRGQSDARGEGG